MKRQILNNNVLKTLLYYDMFSFPLNKEELFAFMPTNSLSRDEFNSYVEEFLQDEATRFAEQDGYFYVKPNSHYIELRKLKKEPTERMWRIARWVTHIVKRFPYVRCIIISGSLSKNNSDKKADLDMMLITEPGRLWVARTMLMLFKKIFLLNSYKFFCINYYITSDHLELEDKNIFTATEVAYVKATYNTELADEFVKANGWIKQYFPNYSFGDSRFTSPGCRPNNRQSLIQKFWELLIPSSFAAKLDKYFMEKTVEHWKHRFAKVDPKDREQMFRSTSSVSKAHPHNMQKLVLTRYSDRLKEFNL